MNGRFFLDTNVFVYSFDGKATMKAARARQLIELGVSTKKGIVSYQVVQEFFNVAFRKFDQPFTVTESEQYLRTVFVPMLSVQSSMLLISQALRLTDQHRLSWYDSLILAASLESQCAVLYSEDFQHGQKFGKLQIKNPFL